MPHGITIESIRDATVTTSHAELQELSSHPEDDYHHNLLKYRVSWSVRLKSAQQHVTMYPDEDVEKKIFYNEGSKQHCYETSCLPGSQYKATITTVSACCVPLKSRTVTFLTKGIYIAPVVHEFH